MTIATMPSPVATPAPYMPALAGAEGADAPGAAPAGVSPVPAQPQTDALAQQGRNLLRDMAQGAPGAAAAEVAAAQAQPDAANPPRTLSGASWVSQFPTSRSLDDLADGFRENATAFVNAMRAAGAHVHISATHRPEERAYLMRYAWDISKGLIQPDQVPDHPNVPINWDHGSKAKSVAAAKEMVRDYGIVHRPSLTSNHIAGTAIDMTISNIIGATVTDGSGQRVKIRSMQDLHQVGASYGVHKLVSDPPHWSANGR